MDLEVTLRKTAEMATGLAGKMIKQSPSFPLASQTRPQDPPLVKYPADNASPGQLRLEQRQRQQQQPRPQRRLNTGNLSLTSTESIQFPVRPGPPFPSPRFPQNSFGPPRTPVAPRIISPVAGAVQYVQRNDNQQRPRGPPPLHPGVLADSYAGCPCGPVFGVARPPHPDDESPVKNVGQRGIIDEQRCVADDKGSTSSVVVSGSMEDASTTDQRKSTMEKVTEEKTTIIGKPTIRGTNSGADDDDDNDVVFDAEKDESKSSMQAEKQEERVVALSPSVVVTSEAQSTTTTIHQAEPSKNDIDGTPVGSTIPRQTVEGSEMLPSTSSEAQKENGTSIESEESTTVVTTTNIVVTGSETTTTRQAEPSKNNVDRTPVGSTVPRQTVEGSEMLPSTSSDGQKKNDTAIESEGSTTVVPTKSIVITGSETMTTVAAPSPPTVTPTLEKPHLSDVVADTTIVVDRVATSDERDTSKSPTLKSTTSNVNDALAETLPSVASSLQDSGLNESLNARAETTENRSVSNLVLTTTDGVTADLNDELKKPSPKLSASSSPRSPKSEGEKKEETTTTTIPVKDSITKNERQKTRTPSPTVKAKENVTTTAKSEISSNEKHDVPIETGRQSRASPEPKKTESPESVCSEMTESDDHGGANESSNASAVPREQPTTNGVAGSPPPTNNKSPSSKPKDNGKGSTTVASSPTKSPSKSATKSLPKTPDNAPSAVSAEKKKLPMNKIQVGAAPSPNLKTVRSKIGSLDNASYRPGGGKVKIESRKLDFSKAQPKIAAKNEKYAPSGGDKKITQVKLQWNAKPKVGSLENATYRPGGGDKKIETVKLDFKDKAKPKVGSKENTKHVPGGGSVKSSATPPARSPLRTPDGIETQKIDIKAESKVGSMENVKHKPGGGDKKVFNDRDYLRQTGSNAESVGGSVSQVERANNESLGSSVERKDNEIPVGSRSSSIPSRSHEPKLATTEGRTVNEEATTLTSEPRFRNSSRKAGKREDERKEKSLESTIDERSDERRKPPSKEFHLPQLAASLEAKSRDSATPGATSESKIALPKLVDPLTPPARAEISQ